MSDFLSSIHPVAVCLIVCAAKIVEITIQSLKTCMMVKGQRLKAAGLGFLECTIWGLVISTIIGTLGDNLFLLAFYCVGYATGLFLGATLEGKIALGTSSIELIANEENTVKIIRYLQENSRGYTVFDGRSGVHNTGVSGAKVTVFPVKLMTSVPSGVWTVSSCIPVPPCTCRVTCSVSVSILMVCI